MTTFTKLLVALALVVVAGCATNQPAQQPALTVVSVAEWGGTAMDPAAKVVPHVPSHITLHHGGVAFLRDKDPKQYLRNLQSWSRGTRKWPDIPYHYLIDLDGIVYEGRDIRYAGDTNTEYDPTGHALIVVLGNFDEVEPNQAQLDAVTAVMAMLATRFNIPVTRIGGHKDFSSQTSCPGKSLYPLLQNGYFQQRVAAVMSRAPQPWTVP